MGRSSATRRRAGSWRGPAQASPELQTPAARLFATAGLTPPPSGVKDARAALRARGVDLTLPDEGDGAAAAGDDGDVRRPSRRARRDAALVLDGVWHERRDGAAVLRGVDLAIAPGERVALMGRNGAGKSTLLRHAAGLMAPTRGTVKAPGRVALLLQDPNDYLLHERVGDEASAEALRAVGLEHLVDRHPRDLSGGQRQRLALAIVLGRRRSAPRSSGSTSRRAGWTGRPRAPWRSGCTGSRDDGAAVVVATHDPEFAAEFADRVVLLGRRAADRRRPGVRRPGRRLVLRDRDRADHRRPARCCPPTAPRCCARARGGARP